MSLHAKQQYLVTAAELETLAPTMGRREADHVFRRCKSIAEAGGSPVVYYSIHHRLLVLNLGDEEDRWLNLQIEPHTRPFSERITNPNLDP
jgi:hypothetical protein